MITIANYGVGNYAAVANMLNFLEIDNEIMEKPQQVDRISHLILPGVGAFDTGMNLLSSSGWRSAVSDLSPSTSILGICLGMHLLTEGSQEGTMQGLGLVKASCKKLDPARSTVPHIGWKAINLIRNNKLIQTDQTPLDFYFSHSYHVKLADSQNEIATSDHGISSFTAVFQQGNIYGCQFHPEKSHKFGMKLLKNFASL